LAWVLNKLHASIVDNHIAELNVWEFGGNLTSTLQEQAIGELHNVGLVDGGNFLATVGFGILKGKASDIFRLFDGGDFVGGDDSWNNLMF